MGAGRQALCTQELDNVRQLSVILPQSDLGKHCRLPLSRISVRNQLLKRVTSACEDVVMRAHHQRRAQIVGAVATEYDAPVRLHLLDALQLLTLHQHQPPGGSTSSATAGGPTGSRLPYPGFLDALSNIHSNINKEKSSTNQISCMIDNKSAEFGMMGLLVKGDTHDYSSHVQRPAGPLCLPAPHTAPLPASAHTGPHTLGGSESGRECADDEHLA